MKKAIAGLIILAALGGIGWLVYRKLTAEKAPRREGRNAAVAVEVAPVQTATIRDAGLFTGSMEARSEYVVAPKIAGRLEKLMVNISDEVKRGQLIAVLDDAEDVRQLEQAQAELDVAKASLIEYQSNIDAVSIELVRVLALHEKKIASDSERDSIQAQYNAAQAKGKVGAAQVEQKGAAFKAAEVRLSYTRINAYWEGGSDTRVVGERFADEGAMLKANEPIVSILDIGTLTAVIYVIEGDYTKVHPGQAVTITADAFPGKTFGGKVARIAPLLKEASRQARVEVEVPNADLLLKPGTFVRAQIEFEHHENACVVPLVALVRRGGKEGVFLADREQKKARFVPLTLGIVSDPVAEVVEPEISGDVVTLGQHLIEDGTAITIHEKAAGGSALPPSVPRPSKREATGATGGNK
jgi:RND family efflux transporter MFP subunit